MSRIRHTPPHFPKNILALAAIAMLTPQGSWALDLLQAPPGTVQAYVAPNVILSLDDSGSMDTKDMILKDPTKPYNASTNPWTKTRAAVLKDALLEVFRDEDLIPPGKMRLAWQTLGDCTKIDKVRWAPKLGTTAASSNNINVMRQLGKKTEGHRANFIKYVENFDTCSYTPTHFMMKRADEYMRAPIHTNGPWATKPGETLNGPNEKPLGCRRNYHIVLTDGEWNGYYYGPGETYFDGDNYQKNNPASNQEEINTNPVNFDNQDSESNDNGKLGPNYPVENTTAFFLPDGTAYKRSDPQTWVYRDVDYPTWSSYHIGYRPCSETQTTSNGVKCTDRWGGYMSTLSDWAFQSWAKPLQDKANLDGSISPLPEYDKAPAEETFENRISKRKVTLKKYWNPRYNPATWPHMTTFTIGFSNDALPENQYRPIGYEENSLSPSWKSNIGKYSTRRKGAKPGTSIDTTNGNNGKLIPPSSTLPYGYDGSFADYASGWAQWHAIAEQQQDDMWHAAINGRGEFYAVEKGEDLKQAFRQIIKTISTDVEPEMTTTATSGSNTSRNAVGRFIGNYEPKNAWKGFLKAELINKDGTYKPIPGWGDKDTASIMDDASFSVDGRTVLTWSDQWTNSKYKGGTYFQWSDSDETYLSTGQKYWLGLKSGATGVTVATNGKNQLNFIRGERSLEGNTASKPLRERKSRQGDIVNSAAWYTGAPSSGYSMAGYSEFVRTRKSRTPMIYVGGNDGMLHGFSTKDGSEKIAYVPRGIIPSLTKLSNPAYNGQHRFFVDGSPMTGDADMGIGIQDPEDPNYDPKYTPDWRTLLVGSLGAGGKGYFILDVTKPDEFKAADPNKIVIIDRTRSTEGNISAPICGTLGTTEKTNCLESSLIRTLPSHCNRTGMTTGEKAACTNETTEDQDIGHITMAPVLDETNSMRTTQITRMNNNRWAVVMGNGYNSYNERAVLLVQYLDGEKELLRIPTSGSVSTPIESGTGLANDNGLSHPRLVDINGDERPDIAYAGDNLGNLWKFDLTNIDHSQWKVAFDGRPLFTAMGGTQGSPDSRTLAQPITVAPSVRPNDRQKTVGTGANAKQVSVGGMMVTFGTGRNLTKADELSKDMQTLYSVLDNTRYREVKTSKGKRLEVHPGGGTCTPIPGPDCAPTPTPLGQGPGSAKLVKRAVIELDSGKAGKIDTAETLDWATHNGWYQDFPTVGERLLKPLEYYDGTNILMVWSQVPAKGSHTTATEETCEANVVDKERQYRSFINIMDGMPPSVQLVDLNGDGTFDDADMGATRRQVREGAHNLLSKSGSENEDIDVKGNREKLAKLPEKSLRPTWRQLR